MPDLVPASAPNAAGRRRQRKPTATKPTWALAPSATDCSTKPATSSATKRPASATQLSVAVKLSKRPSSSTGNPKESVLAGKLSRASPCIQGVAACPAIQQQPVLNDGTESFCLAVQSTTHPAHNWQRGENSSSSASPCMQGVAAQPASHQPLVMFSDGAESFCVPVQATTRTARDWQRSNVAYNSPSRSAFATCPPRRLMSFPTGDSEHGMSSSPGAHPQMPFAPQMLQGAYFTPGAAHPLGPQYSHYQPQLFHAHHDVYAYAPTPSPIRFNMQPAGRTSTGYESAVGFDHPTWSAGHYSSSSGLARNNHTMHRQTMDDMSCGCLPTSSSDFRSGGPACWPGQCLLQPTWDLLPAL